MPSKPKLQNIHGNSVDSDGVLTKKSDIRDVTAHFSMTPSGAARMYEQLKDCIDIDTGKEYTQK